MENKQFVNIFKNNLRDQNMFSIQQLTPQQWVLVSEKCIITFVFERFEEGLPLITLSQPDANGVQLHFLLLRHLFGAKDELKDRSSPENLARIFDTYFSALKAGDFSIAVKYQEIEDVFFEMLFDIDFLPDDDPIKIKAKNYDISWMDDMGRGG